MQCSIPQIILRAQGIQPAGLGARDTLRLEAGMNLYGNDMDETVSPLSTGGTPVERIRLAGRSEATIYLGDSLARAAEVLKEKFGIPTYGFTSITGLAEADLFMETLGAISGRPAPEKFRRWRSRLMDAMADAHYQFGTKIVALALEADLLKIMTNFLAGLGCEIGLCVVALGLPNSFGIGNGNFPPL